MQNGADIAVALEDSDGGWRRLRRGGISADKNNANQECGEKSAGPAHENPPSEFSASEISNRHCNGSRKLHRADGLFDNFFANFAAFLRVLRG